MTRGNAHLVQVSSTSALSQARSICELSSLLVQQHDTSQPSTSAITADSVEEVLVRLQRVTITAIDVLSASVSTLLLPTSSSSPSSSRPTSSILVAVGTKDGRVTLFDLSLPVSLGVVAAPVLAGSFVATSEYITELSFAPSTTTASSTASSLLPTLHLAVGDSSGVTTVWELSGEVGSVQATPLHVFVPAIPHAPVSILTWHRPFSPTAASQPIADGGGCDSCSVVERCGANHVILAAGVASSVSIHYFHLPSLVLCSSYPLPAQHSLPISSLILTSLPTCTLPLLISSSTSSASYRHLLTSTAAIHHSHYHRPTLVSALPARYGLSLTADGLLLLGCTVRMAETRSLKKKDGLYIVSVKAWPVGDLDGRREEADSNQLLVRELATPKKRTRREGAKVKRVETEKEKAVRWTQQHRLLDEFSSLCDALTESGVSRCHFSLCLYLTARLSPLSHLLARALSEPPPFNPHTSPAHIRFLDALAAWLEAQLPTVITGSLAWSAMQSRIRTLHFLAMFASRCTSGDCQFVELTSEQKARLVHVGKQLEAILSTRHFSARLTSTSSSTTAAAIHTALTLLAPQLPTDLPTVPSASADSGGGVGVGGGGAMTERCGVCGVVIEFESLRWAECSSGHRWYRDADTLCVMSGVSSYVECAQCGARAVCDGAVSSNGEASDCCWMCGVVCVRGEV